MTYVLGDGLHSRIDRLFTEHSAVFGADLERYEGHVHRVAELISLQVPLDETTTEIVAVASFFHDSAIWFDDTWDYLPGSVARAVDAIGGPDSTDAALVAAMVLEHHRIRPVRAHPMVEAIRRADAADLYRVMPPGVRRNDFRTLLHEYPSRGFHRMLLRAFLRGVRRDPVHPLPMVRF